MNETHNNEIYLFFAPPRVGNHWVELLISGLYFICPEKIFSKNGDVVDESRLADNAMIQIVLPEITEENPILFLERGEDKNHELVSRAKEIDLSIVRNLVRSGDQKAPGEPLRMQWYHGEYHAFPFVPDIDKLNLKLKYCFLVRSPQATAYSYYNVSNDRWSGSRSYRTKFLDIYTVQWINSLIDFYAAYAEISKTHRAFFFKYEELTKDWKLLEEFCHDFVGYLPKLEPEFVWKLAQFDRLTNKAKKRTFYRNGTADSWIKGLTRKELNRMMEIEDAVDFDRTGYPRTTEILGKNKRFVWSI